MDGSRCGRCWYRTRTGTNAVARDEGNARSRQNERTREVDKREETAKTHREREQKTMRRTTRSDASTCGYLEEEYVEYLHVVTEYHNASVKPQR